MGHILLDWTHHNVIGISVQSHNARHWRTERWTYMSSAFFVKKDESTRSKIRKLKQTQCKHLPSFDPFWTTVAQTKRKRWDARPLNKMAIYWTTSTNNLFSGIIIWRQSSQLTRNDADKQSSWYFVCYHQVFNDLTGRHLIEKCTLVFFCLSKQVCTNEHI